MRPAWSAGAARAPSYADRMAERGAAERELLAPAPIWLATSPSTNLQLIELAAADPALADFSALATLDQTAGRGRLDRTWSAPAGTALAVSVLVRLGRGGAAAWGDRLGWLPIAAGLAMAEVVADVLGADAAVRMKWPNDVLVGERKISGVLAELLPGGDAVVLGAGVNIGMRDDELPVPTATSLRIELGSVEPPTAARVLDGYLDGLRRLTAALRAHDGDRSGIRALARRRCTTLGRRVRVETPDGVTRTGLATDLDVHGRLLVALDDGTPLVVAAGDVTHLRHA